MPPSDAERGGQERRTTNASARGVVIRTAARADIPRVWELMRELARYERLEHILSNTPERLEQQLFDHRWPEVECRVAEFGGELVGYALFFGCYSSFRGQPVIWLEDLYVMERCRGEGVGRALMRELAGLARERGCARLSWDVLDWNQPSIDFYERLGATRGADWYTYSLSGEKLHELGSK